MKDATLTSVTSVSFLWCNVKRSPYLILLLASISISVITDPHCAKIMSLKGYVCVRGLRCPGSLVSGGSLCSTQAAGTGPPIDKTNRLGSFNQCVKYTVARSPELLKIAQGYQNKMG